MTIRSNDLSNRSNGLSRRQASIVAGIGLLLMAVLAPIANFGALLNLVVDGDPAATASNILSSTGLFRTGIFLFLVVAILDVIVAWALYYLFLPANRALSLLTAWFRLAYAAVFVVAAGHLMQVLHLLTGTGGVGSLGREQIHATAMLQLKQFMTTWDSGLLVFAAHLLVLGYLVFKSSVFPKFLGILVTLAGLGYSIDSLGKILVPGYGLTISMYTFIGEVLLIFWLFRRGFRGFEEEKSPDTPA